mgnify:CR=1 FL=1
MLALANLNLKASNNNIKHPRELTCPSYYVAPKGLYKQVTKEIKYFYLIANVMFISSNPAAVNSKYACLEAFPRLKDPV